MTEDSGIANFFDKPKVPITNTPVPTRIFTAYSSTMGKGSVDRTEELKTNVAGGRGEASIVERQPGDRG